MTTPLFQRTFCLFFLSIGLMSTALPLKASEHNHASHTSHAPHVHGRASLDMLLDKQTMAVDVRIPADTLFGFAHPPKTDAQKTRMQQRHQALKTAVIQFSDQAQCQITQAQWHNPLAETQTHAKTTAKTTPLADGHAQRSHSDIEIHWRYHCRQPQALKEADFAPLFQAWPRLQQIEWTWLMPEHPANARQVTAEHPVHQLSP